MNLDNISDLIHLCHLQAELRPDATAFQFTTSSNAPAGRLSYGELAMEAVAMAAGLQAQGAQGQRALILLPSGADYLKAFFGCVFAGTVAVPLLPPGSGRHFDRLLAVVSDCKAKFLITSKESWLAMEQMEGGIPQALQAMTRLFVNEAWGNQTWRNPESGSQGIAYLQYTSGSTGDPKGVMLTHGNLLANVRLITRALGLNSADKFVTCLPMFHDMGLIGTVLAPLYAGVPSVIMPQTTLVRPRNWLKEISTQRGTITVAPNFAFDYCADKISDDQLASLDLSSLRLVLNGAEPVRPATMARFLAKFAAAGLKGDPFLPCYGLAEATLLVSVRNSAQANALKTFDAERLNERVAVELAANEDSPHKRTLVGHGSPLGDVSVKIVRPNSAELCDVGEIGEVCVSGASVASGYWDKAALNAKVFGLRLDHRRYLRTGDLGFIGADGQLYISGRLKDVIIVRGRNIYPNDIEYAAAKSAPHLRTGAAFATDDAVPRVILIQEAKIGEGEATDEAKKAIMEAVLQDVGIAIDDIKFVRPGRIPMTSSGKVRRQACRALYLNHAI